MTTPQNALYEINYEVKEIKNILIGEEEDDGLEALHKKINCFQDDIAVIKTSFGVISNQLSLLIELYLKKEKQFEQISRFVQADSVRMYDDKGNEIIVPKCVKCQTFKSLVRVETDLAWVCGSCGGQ
jgi:hypothetical protein